jgi:hypothetical protein
MGQAGPLFMEVSFAINFKYVRIIITYMKTVCLKYPLADFAGGEQSNALDDFNKV